MTELSTFDSPILVSSLESVKTVARRLVGNPNIRVLGITNEQYDRELGITSGSDRYYPYITIMPTDVDDDPTYNTFALNTDGWSVKRVENYIYKLRLVPVKFSLGLSYFTQDSKQVLHFIEKWKYNYRKCTFRLTDESEMFNVDIHVELEPLLRFPTKDMETGNCYKADGVMTLHTYAGQVVRQRIATQVELREYLKKLETSHDNNANLDKFKNNNFELINKFIVKEKQERVNESNNS